MNGTGLKILIVEDEVSIRSLMEMEFQDQGFDTRAVGTVSDAQKIIEDREAGIDLCIFDLKLPDGDGLTLLQKTKACLPHTPVILMTGHGNKSTVLEALKRGAYDYIEKPFSITNDLFPVVDRAVDSVRLKRENSSLNEQILHNSKLAVLGELAATVLHDIRGPLGLIQVVCEDMSEDAKDNGNLPQEEVAKHVEQIQKACDRIKKLGDHLRNYARQDKNEVMECKDLELLLEDSLFLVQQKVRKMGITVTKTMDPNSLNVQLKCFPNKFEQVVMNLCSNACDAMKDAPQKELTIHSRNDGHWVYVDVTDTGTGIPKDIQDRIFENYFTTKPKGEGTGLGLNIVRNIVREHGGELLLKSELGKGTTFTVKIPHPEHIDSVIQQGGYAQVNASSGAKAA